MNGNQLLLLTGAVLSCSIQLRVFFQVHVMNLYLLVTLFQFVKLSNVCTSASHSVIRIVDVNILTQCSRLDIQCLLHVHQVLTLIMDIVLNKTFSQQNSANFFTVKRSRVAPLLAFFYSAF